MPTSTVFGVLAVAAWLVSAVRALQQINPTTQAAVNCHAKDFRRTKRRGPWVGVRYLACNFSGMRLEELRCAESVLSDSNFHQGHLTGAVLARNVLSRCNFNQADLSGAQLDHSDARSASFYGANCFEANFEYANLMHCKFVDADLRGANLGGARLNFANLRFADLRGANLYFADLGGCDLFGADLRDCQISSYDLRGAKNAHMAYGIHDRLSHVSDIPPHMERVEHLVLPVFDVELEELCLARGCDLDLVRHLLERQRTNVSLAEIIDVAEQLSKQ